MGLVGIACVPHSAGSSPSLLLLAVEANFRATMMKDIGKSLDSGTDSIGVDSKEVHGTVGRDRSLAVRKLASS